jgi:hypothetical protein
MDAFRLEDREPRGFEITGAEALDASLELRSCGNDTGITAVPTKIAKGRP